MKKQNFVLLAVGICALSIGVYTYPRIGKAPEVPEQLLTKDALRVGNNSNITLSFPKAGRLESILVKEGDKVAKGQVLAQLNAPDALGLLTQTEGAYKLAEAQFVSLNSQFATAKKQQDILVKNAYNTLLSSGLEATPNVQDTYAPIITGTYTCEKEGVYTMKAYPSHDNDSNHSLEYSGLESGTVGVKFDNAIPLGNCGLQIRYNRNSNASINTYTTWTIKIPNEKSSSYLANKNAYNLAVANREKVLADLATTIGDAGGDSVARAQITAAKGAYEAAKGAYQNNLITAPADGIITFVDQDAKNGQAVLANKTLISMITR